MSSSAQVHIKAAAWSGRQTMRTTNQTLRIYFNEAKYEFLKLLRLPIYAISTIAFPLMFYVLFGLVLNQMQTVGSISAGTYLLAAYGAVGVMGLAIGYFAGPTSAPAVCNVLYLPMAFASGLWVPMEFLPKFMQSIAPFLPPYHFVQLALAQVGARHSGGQWVHIAALNGFTLLFLVLAAVGYRRDEGKMYG